MFGGGESCRVNILETLTNVYIHKLLIPEFFLSSISMTLSDFYDS